MSRTFQDHDFLVWEVFASGGMHSRSEHPHVVFNCLTRRDVRPRFLDYGQTESQAERLIVESSTRELLDLLERAQPLD